MGHVRDLPKAKLGVETDKDFEPTYVIPRAKRKTVENLKELLAKVKDIILATDPDREGEAIAWHISELAVGSKKHTEKFKRIVFHEITKEAIAEALKSPRGIDLKLVDAQVARRVLDRLVGYKLSPLLWFKVKRGLSAGRVQSVAVRLIVEREREIDKFVPQEYWSIEAILKGQKAASSQQFESSLSQIDGKKAEVKNEKEASKIVGELENKENSWEVAKIDQKQSPRYPHPPFTTSTMTQTASYSLGFTSKKTMKLAQDLYEEGLISYHRTDSVNLASSAISSARKFIKEAFGEKYVPKTPRVYKTKSKLAQEAHEAIRPTNVGISKDKIHLPAGKVGVSNDHKKLYDLIWKRFTACQMAEAIYDQISLDIAVKNPTSKINYLFRASGSSVIFDGWQKVYGRVDQEDKLLPILKVGDKLDLLNLAPNQHFTEPPARYTEATLIKTLEEEGIGRPSTYAPIISTILERHYVELEERKFKPTPLGIATNDFLVENFSDLISVPFTAKMEDQLDDIANGEQEWKPMIRDFYGPFEKHLESVSETAEKVKVFTIATGDKCPEGHNLVIRYGRFGKFLACEKFPEHKFTKTIESSEFKAKNEELERLKLKCPDSGHDVILKQTRRGKIFYGCGGYPKCKWMSWSLPQTAYQETPKK